MIEISMRLMDSEGLKGKLDRIASEYPKLLRKAIGATGRIIKARLWNIMRAQGGVHHVPKFEPWNVNTWKIKMNSDRPNAGQIGGKLGEKYAIQQYNRRGVVMVGWISALEKHIDLFQAAEIKAFTSEERKRFHRLGIHDAIQYERPARPVIPGFAYELQAKVPKWFVDVLNKALAKQHIRQVRFTPGEPLPASEGIS